MLKGFIMFSIFALFSFGHLRSPCSFFSLSISSSSPAQLSLSLSLFVFHLFCPLLCCCYSVCARFHLHCLPVSFRYSAVPALYFIWDHFVLFCFVSVVFTFSIGAFGFMLDSSNSDIETILFSATIRAFGFRLNIYLLKLIRAASTFVVIRLRLCVHVCARSRSLAYVCTYVKHIIINRLLSIVVVLVAA